MRKVQCICIMMCMGLTFSSASCSNSTSNKYDKAAKEAAETVLKNEVADYTWTTVEVGDLSYRYTAFNEELDKYRVYYWTSFNPEDEPEDEFIEIKVELTGKELLVADAECSFFSADIYEHEKDSKPTRIDDGKGKWTVID